MSLVCTRLVYSWFKAPARVWSPSLIWGYSEEQFASRDGVLGYHNGGASAGSVGAPRGWCFGHW